MATEFYSMLCTFLKEMSDMFPDCEELRGKLTVAKQFEGEPAVAEISRAQWRKNMTPEALRMLEAKDPALFTLLDRHKLLKGVNFQHKYTAAADDADFCDSAWWYLKKLSLLADSEYAAARKQRKKIAKADSAVATVPEGMEAAVAAAERLQKKLGIAIDESSGEVRLNFKKLLAANPAGDADMQQVMAASAALLPSMMSASAPE